MSEQFRLWVDGCEMNNTNLYELARLNDFNVGFYRTKRKYEKNNIYYWTSPVYHVWYGDVHKVFSNYKEAYDFYMRFADYLSEIDL